MTTYKNIFRKTLVEGDYYIMIIDANTFFPEEHIIKYLGDLVIKGRTYCEYVTISTIMQNKQTKVKRLYSTVYHAKKLNFIPISEDTFNDYLKQLKNA